MDLNPLFKPDSMAVIGVSTSHDAHPANVIYTKNLLRYPVKTYAVNPRGGKIHNEMLYASVTDIEDPVDMAVIGVRARHVPEVLTQCIAKGVKGAVIISGGFSESGNQALQDEVVQIARAANFPIVGPNCLGIYAPDQVDTFFCQGSGSSGRTRAISVLSPRAAGCSLTRWSSLPARASG